MMLSGNLSDWSVGDLLQMLHITKKTASLHVDGADRSGVVYFEEGSIVNADVSLGGGPKSAPRDEVIEAVYVLELLDEGSFEIKNEVPPRMIDPLPVAEALELAGDHLDAERRLDETGLLAARGLRLAQTIEEPIILSEQVWNAISVSIPAFTFPELEDRLGRAAAVATVEQFRDLGILEAVLEDVEPTPAVPLEVSPPAANGSGDGASAFDSHGEDAFAEAWTPPAPEPMDDSWTPPVGADAENSGALPETEAVEESWIDPEAEVVGDSWITPDSDVDDGSWPTPTSDPETDGGAVVATDDPGADDTEGIVPHGSDEVRPITSTAPDDSIVVSEDQPVEDLVEAAATGPASGVSSLSEAIRAAAAGASSLSDDEAQLLTEAATDVPEGGDASLRRSVKSLVSPSGSPESSGLGHLSARFRQAAAERED